MKALVARNLRKRFGKRDVVKGVSLEVFSKEIVGLVGPNGAGKTTTFYMISGFLLPDAGKIFLGNKDISSLTVQERAKEGIIYLPQETSVFRKLTVEENIKCSAEIYQRDGIERYVEELLKIFGLYHLRRKKGEKLSGGERRRVEIARALATSPSFLLLDEPFTGIDPIMISELRELIVMLKNKGLGVLLSDHNVREVLRICDRIYIISEGEVIFEGSPHEVVRSEEVRKVYLGEEF